MAVGNGREGKKKSREGRDRGAVLASDLQWPSVGAVYLTVKSATK